MGETKSGEVINLRAKMKPPADLSPFSLRPLPVTPLPRLHLQIYFLLLAILSPHKRSLSCIRHLGANVCHPLITQLVFNKGSGQ